MSQAFFVQRGETIDYTPNFNVAAGSVVVSGDLIGVATREILANRLGTLTVEGVFDFPKVTGPGNALLFGSTVYWDFDNKVVTPIASDNKLLGKVVRTAGENDPRVLVRLTQ